MLIESQSAFSLRGHLHSFIKQTSFCLLSRITVPSLQKAVKQKNGYPTLIKACVSSLGCPRPRQSAGRKQSSTILDNGNRHAYALPVRRLGNGHRMVCGPRLEEMEV